ncbi:MAG: NAD(P)-dependent oxidoreductase [Acuticoccus sp.]
MRLLLTGAAGFVGSAVAETAASRGHEVMGLDRRPGTAAGIVADVTDRAAVAEAAAGCEAIIHAAAVVGPDPARADPAGATRINVDGTLAVLEAARAGGQSVVCVSTATLYGRRHDLAPLDEAGPVDPVSVYDATKLMAETLCEAYAKTFATPVASFRTSFVYGLGHSTGDYYVHRLLDGERLIEDTGAGHPCDFTYVHDLALGLVQAAEAGRLPERIYNLSGGVLRTRGDLAAAVLRHFPDATIVHSEGVDPNRHLRGVCRIERARRDFGYSPRFTLEAGIADMVARGRAQSPA